MTGKIHRDNVKIGQQRRQLRKASGIIQPPMQREQRPATWVAPREARQLKPINMPFQWDCSTEERKSQTLDTLLVSRRERPKYPVSKAWSDRVQ